MIRANHPPTTSSGPTTPSARLRRSRLMSGQGFVTRLAGKTDVEAIGAFIIEAWGQAGPGALGWTGATDGNIREIASREFLETLLERADARVFLALAGDRVVGFASTERVDEEVVELSGIIVLEELKGRGVGGSLLEAAAEVAGEDGYAEMTVRTEPYNERAIAFYTAKGFKPESTRVIIVEGREVEVVELSLGLGDA